MRLVFVLLSLIFASVCSAADLPIPAALPSRSTPEDLKGLVWNKWETKHFAVISLDRSSGASLKSEVERKREEALSAWGIRASDAIFCKLVLVPDEAMLVRLFGLKEPKCEVRRSGTSAPEAVSIWVDSSRMSRLPALLAEAEVAAGDSPAFIRRGFPILASGPDSLRDSIPKSTDAPLLSMFDEKKSAELIKVDPKGFDANCAVLCLMVRKEYGARAFGVATSTPQTSLHGKMGFASADEFDRTFARYRKNLLDDMKASRTPDEYLRVAP